MGSIAQEVLRESSIISLLSQWPSSHPGAVNSTSIYWIKKDLFSTVPKPKMVPVLQSHPLSCTCACCHSPRPSLSLPLLQHSFPLPTSSPLSLCSKPGGAAYLSLLYITQKMIIVITFLSYPYKELMGTRLQWSNFRVTTLWRRSDYMMQSVRIELYGWMGIGSQTVRVPVLAAHWWGKDTAYVPLPPNTFLFASCTLCLNHGNKIISAQVKFCGQALT